MRTFDPQSLVSPDVTSLSWAHAYVRSTLRDTPNEAGAYPDGSYLDVEIDARLALTAVPLDNDEMGYRPHVAAAELVQADPRRATSMSVGGLSETLPDADRVAAGILRAGVSIDRLIRSAGGDPPSSGMLRMRTVF